MERGVKDPRYYAFSVTRFGKWRICCETNCFKTVEVTMTEREKMLAGELYDCGDE